PCTAPAPTAHATGPSATRWRCRWQSGSVGGLWRWSRGYLITPGLRPGREGMDVYVYQQTEPGLWTVGFYDPQGRWHAESDHTSPESAAERVHWLNGGNRTADTEQAAERQKYP